MATDPNKTEHSVNLYVRQLKETSFEQDASGAYSVETELPGFLELVAEIDGAAWVIARRKAPGLLADIERAKQPPPTPTPTA